MDRAAADRTDAPGLEKRAHAGAASVGDSPVGVPTERTGRRLPTIRSVAAKPVARHLAVAICYLAAGVAVTWPRATYLAGTPALLTGLG